MDLCDNPDVYIPNGGTIEDAHEYYDNMLDILPYGMKDRMMIQIAPSITKEPIHWASHIRCTADMQMLISHVLHTSSVICVYRNGIFDTNTGQASVPSINIRNCMQLELRTQNGHKDVYRARAFVCSVPGHYYSLVSRDGLPDRDMKSWYICDGSTMRLSDTWNHPIYMIFYSIYGR